MTGSGSAAAALAVLLIVAPAVSGVAGRTKAFLTRRRGAPILQLYVDLAKCTRRGVVWSGTTTLIFRVAPVALLAAVLVAATVVPLDGRSALISFPGDVVAFAYALGLGRFLLVLAALDTGSSFEGMGASREVTVAAFVELGLFLAFGTLAVLTKQLSLSGMLGAPLAATWRAASPAIAMTAVSLFALMLAECARVPVDDPATHLELTMIHEVMILDHSGPDLALIHYASAIKLSLVAALIVDLVIPRGVVPLGGSLAILAAGLVVVGIAVGVVEASVARMRMPKIPLYLAGASSLGLFSLVLVLWSGA
ncbi:MAG TPA: NADH-quinone oxidoreductase subunit H [Gemmatimonadaceae bacterium]|nr:NADH-quinone oxidoreductase subunit H [Gemmatimonadaceae bacterium]